MADDERGSLSPLARRIAYHCCEYHDCSEYGPCPMPHDLIGRYIQNHIAKHRFVLNDVVSMLRHLISDPSVFDKDTTYLWVEALEYIVNDMTKPCDLKTQGWVYFIQCGKYIKIGLSSNVESRFRALQTATPYPLILLKKLPVPNMVRAEARLHNHFSYARRKGEWFLLNEEDVHEILMLESLDVWYLEEDEIDGSNTPKSQGRDVTDGTPDDKRSATSLLVSEAVS